MKRFVLVLVLTIMLPLCVRADEILVGQMCTSHCQHQHFDSSFDYRFSFNLDKQARADELQIEGQNFPGEQDITDVYLTGPGGIDLQFQLTCSGCFLDFHFDALFPTGSYQVRLHSEEGVFTVLIGDQFTEDGCCGTMNGLQQAFVNGTPTAIPEAASLSFVGGGLGVIIGAVRRRRSA